MTKPRDPDALLSAYLAAGMEVLPDRVVDSVLDEVHRTRQRAVFGPWRTRSMTRTTFAAAAVVAAVALGGTFFVLQRGQPVITGPAPTASASAPASQPAVAVPSPTTTPAPTAAVTPPAALSPVLTWTKVDTDGGLRNVAWLRDRFVLLDDSGAVSTSTDGVTWHALQPGDPDPGYAELLEDSMVVWQDQVVGWRNPEGSGNIAGQPPITARDVLRIVRPPAEPTVTTPFKGRIESIGIGPKGIVAQVHSHLDWDAWVASKLGDDWVSRYEEVSFKNGILEIKMKRGKGLKVVWADQGFELGDFQDAGFGWYSPDGVQWTPMPTPKWSPDQDSGLGFVTGFGDVVGVSDGFIARGDDPADTCPIPAGCGNMWHSSDGLTWRNLGRPARASVQGSVMLPWKGGALVTDGIGRFSYWTSSGYSELPMDANLASPAERQDVSVGTGPLGLVSVMEGDKNVLVTRDGVDWDLRSMPGAMAAAQTGWRSNPTIAVGDRSVLVVLWARTGSEKEIPTLWLGTFGP